MSDQAFRLREMASSEDKRPVMAIPKCITVTSGKGGVGKSNISVMLAMAIASLEKRVLLFDGDMGLANIHILLGVAPKNTLKDVIEGKCSIEDTFFNVSENVILIPGASGVSAMANISAKAVEPLVNSLQKLESGFDYILIDGGAGIADVTMKLASLSDEPIVVMTPEPTSLADAYSVIKILNSTVSKDISVIVNMALSDREGKEAFDKLNSIAKKFINRNLRFSGVVPFDKTVQKMIREQRNTFLYAGSSKTVERIVNIAKHICKFETLPQSESFFKRFFLSFSSERV